MGRKKRAENIRDNIKGRIAEAIVEQIFKRSGAEIYFHGIEWRQIKDWTSGRVIMNDLFEEISIPLSKFKNPPDFLLMTNAGYFYEFIEVKFRNLGKMFLDHTGKKKDDRDFFHDLQELEDQDVKVLWVSQEKIEVIVYPYMNEDGSLVKQSVESQASWGINPDVYKECLKYLKLYSFFFSKSDKE